MGLAALTSSSALANVTRVVWDELPPLPPATGQTKQPGVAGPFVGVHGDVLIVAGGANFPDKMPWDGGAKVWWDDIWVLERRKDGTARWITDKHLKLPRRLGYGVSVSTAEGVICAGGNDAERCYADVFLLAWDAKAREMRRTALPPMPQPLSMMAGAVAGNILFVAGGQHAMSGAVPSTAFWSLDLSKRNEPAQFKWTVLPPWPGPARIVPVAAGLHTSRGDEFFLFSGRLQQAGRRTEILSDAYAFDPKTQTWRTLAKIGGQNGVSLMAGTAAAWRNEILLFGGDRGELFLELESHDLKVEALRAKLGLATGDERTRLQKEIDDHLAAKRAIYGTHPGFGREVFAYDPDRDSWRVVGTSKFPPQVTTNAAVWGDAIVIPSGEIKPGIRTPQMARARPVEK